MARQMRTFDRRVHFDERSRQYPVRTLVADKPPRSYTWSCYGWLDQGSEGACVGFGWSHELIARPAVITVDNQFARKLYRRAQQLDDFPGENYQGTSVLAGAKAILESGYMKEYRWAFGLNDLIMAIGYLGGAVLGLNWYEGMFDHDSKHFIHATGSLAGGHCILANGLKLVKLDSSKMLSLDNIDLNKSYVRLHNSWGNKWGLNGECFMSLTDLDRLLHEDGEACIPVTRIKL